MGRGTGGGRGWHRRGGQPGRRKARRHGGCHDAGNFNNRHIANDFTSYDDWLNSGYITGVAK